MSESDVADELAAGFAGAWNSHEMDEFARLFHEDAVFVTVRGTYLNGQEEIRRHHAAAHAGPFRQSALRAEVGDARELAPGVIASHMRTELDGEDRVPGQTRRSLMTLVIEQRVGVWRFAAALTPTSCRRLPEQQPPTWPDAGDTCN